MADVAKEYAILRTQYLDSQKEKSYVSLAKARQKKLNTDWKKQVITKPSFLGTKVFNDYDLKKVIPYIDWDPFF